MKRLQRYLLPILLVSLVVLVFFIWNSARVGKESNILKVVFLDVGQGDAIYIEAPNGRQMLVDAGANSAVLSALSEVMPFADRSIDLVLATHTDADHIGGFPLILDSYEVGQVIENGGTSDTLIYKSFQDQIAKHKITKTIGKKGNRIILDKEKNIYFDILFPDRDISKMESNDASIVGRLVYGEQSFLLTGDATKFTENILIRSNSIEALQADVLKLGHHGSHTSSSELFLEKVNPDVTIISAGKNNRYGHPHKDVLSMLSKLQIPYKATYEEGNLIFKTDGLELVY